VETICKKYNLVNAPVSHFKGFVPDAKLKQIEGFRLKGGEDERQELVRIVSAWGVGLGNKATVEAIHKTIGEWITPDKINGYGRSAASVMVRGHRLWVEKVEVRNQAGLTICAPEKDFDLTGLKKKGFSFFQTKVVTYPDPVVLQPVKHGHLILACWGDEASDPIVVNEINN